MAELAEAALIALRRILRVTETQSRALARDTGLTASQVIVLRIVSYARGASAGQIAERAGISQATVSTLLDKLDEGFDVVSGVRVDRHDVRVLRVVGLQQRVEVDRRGQGALGVEVRVAGVVEDDRVDLGAVAVEQREVRRAAVAARVEVQVAIEAAVGDVRREQQARLELLHAHHAAPASGRKYAVDTQITRIVRDLAPRFEHRLFLTATPHNGHRNSFAALMEILDPQRFLRGVKVEPTQLEPVMVRRLKADLRGLGQLMTMNHKLLSALMLSTDALEEMIAAATNAGAFGAKVTGAGGGGCMVALVDSSTKPAVTKALRELGRTVYEVESGS